MERNETGARASISERGTLRVGKRASHVCRRSAHHMVMIMVVVIVIILNETTLVVYVAQIQFPKMQSKQSMQTKPKRKDVGG